MRGVGFLLAVNGGLGGQSRGVLVGDGPVSETGEKDEEEKHESRAASCDSVRGVAAGVPAHERAVLAPVGVDVVVAGHLRPLVVECLPTESSVKVRVPLGVRRRWARRPLLRCQMTIPVAMQMSTAMGMAAGG